jgi:hypothetical protein
MKHPAQWNKDDLYKHLQHALDLELWTIPLYLTALYSIKGLKNLKSHDYPDAAKLVFAVVIQEMLHLELVCNICNAMGHSPRLKLPVYDELKGIPFIHPPKHYLPECLNGYCIKLGALNENTLKLFCAIELPHPKREIAWDNEHSYSSIADLYEALKIGVTTLWNDLYVGDHRNIYQKSMFKEYHNTNGRNHGFSQPVFTQETAVKAIDAIVEQGEGADSKKVPADFRPHLIPDEADNDAFMHKVHLSHFHKFSILLHHPHKRPQVYEEIPNEENLELQIEMQKVFRDFLKDVENDFNIVGSELSKGLWHKMSALREPMIKVWESGSCPNFHPIN